MEYKVAVVDDSPVDRTLIKKIVEKGTSRVKVLECEDGQTLKALIELEDIKVIILDLILKNEKGLSILKGLKERQETANIPVIIFSALTGAEIIEEAIDLGAYDYFEKPLSKNDISFALALKVKNALKLKLSMDHMSFLRDHDLLTGLHTRSYLEGVINKWSYKEDPVALIIIDINGLKVINDVYGFRTGDDILKSIGRELKASCSKAKCVARWGSDEFAILMEPREKKGLEVYIDGLIDQLYLSQETDFELSYGYKYDVISSDHTYEFIREAEDHLSSNKVLASSSFKNNMIKTIMNTLHQKNHREELHSKRVSAITRLIAEKMNFSSYEIKKIQVAGLMHDIGKIAIDEAVLNKVGALDDQEWLQIKKHPETGFRILSTSADTLDVAHAVLGHHERWDGKGYPQGLKGEEIPLMARIIGIADVFDAMTAERTYRKAVPIRQAIEEIQACSGSQFDPYLVDIFVEVMREYDDAVHLIFD